MKKLRRQLLSGFAQSVPSSGIREVFNLAISRDDVLHLELGEPDFETPQHIVEAAFEAAREHSGYTQTAGMREVREAAASRLRRVHGLDLDPDLILITQGAVQAIATVFAALVAPGDEVLIPDPGWPNYKMLTLSHGGLPVPYPLRAENSFLPDTNEIRSLFSPRSKLIVINSPGNPTGAVLPQSQVDEIVRLAGDAGVVVLSDEVYDEIVFEGGSPTTAMFADNADSLVGVWSCSKTYAMTGWRVGYMTAGDQLLPTFTALQEASISCVSSVTQAAAKAAFSGPQDCVAEMRDSYERRRDLVLKRLDEEGIEAVKPMGAFYLMFPLSPGADSRRAAIHLVDHGVAAAPGSAFGEVSRSHLRISLASSEDALLGACDRLLHWYEATEGGVAL